MLSVAAGDGGIRANLIPKTGDPVLPVPAGFHRNRQQDG